MRTLTSDTNPCARAGDHIATQRHPQTECPAEPVRTETGHVIVYMPHSGLMHLADAYDGWTLVTLCGQQQHGAVALDRAESAYARCPRCTEAAL